MCGLDFASLEDRISALTTKDPNKLKVYIESYDGHCLRAYSYFKDKMPDITDELNVCTKEEDRVHIINSIKSRYPELRQKSKSPTFALTYKGTYRTLMVNCGFSEEEAKHIEERYHFLYKVSDDWVNNNIYQATQKGYVECAFGLRVRTPILKQTVIDTKQTPKEAEQEARTAGNALGQSWCLLNNRAAIEFNRLVRESKFKHNIRPCAHIHDAQYFIIKDDIETVLWANKYLVKAVNWQDDPVIYHPQVGLGGEFSIFYPTWANEIQIPNECTKDNLLSICRKDL